MAKVYGFVGHWDQDLCICDDTATDDSQEVFRKTVVSLQGEASHKSKNSLTDFSCTCGLL